MSPPRTAGKMTARRKRFVREYLVDLNATDAARRAGYSAKSSKQMGWQLMHDRNVLDAIAAEQKKVAERTGISQERVIKELARIAFSNKADFAKWGPGGVELLSSTDLDEDDARCVSEVSQTVTDSGGTLKFKLHDKVRALELLGKHLGIFSDNINLRTPDGPLEVTVTRRVVKAA